VIASSTSVPNAAIAVTRSTSRQRLCKYCPLDLEDEGLLTMNSSLSARDPLTSKGITSHRFTLRALYTDGDSNFQHCLWATERNAEAVDGLASATPVIA